MKIKAKYKTYLDWDYPTGNFLCLEIKYKEKEDFYYNNISYNLEEKMFQWMDKSEDVKNEYNALSKIERKRKLVNIINSESMIALVKMGVKEDLIRKECIMNEYELNAALNKGWNNLEFEIDK